MKKVVLTYGLISGAIVSGLMSSLVVFVRNGEVDFSGGEVIGYSSIVLSFLLVFLGVRRYREDAGGKITFWKGFQVGILIVLVSSAMYVATWQVVYRTLVPDFMEKYAEHVIQKARAEGATPQQVAEQQQKMADLQRLYKNPLINIGMTLMEVLPVGVAVALISAGILRKKGPAPAAEAMA